MRSLNLKNKVMLKIMQNFLYTNFWPLFLHQNYWLSDSYFFGAHPVCKHHILINDYENCGDLDMSWSVIDCEMRTSVQNLSSKWYRFLTGINACIFNKFCSLFSWMSFLFCGVRYRTFWYQIKVKIRQIRSLQFCTSGYSGSDSINVSHY